jgi:TrmH family RNA methyltransferase
MGAHGKKPRGHGSNTGRKAATVRQPRPVLVPSRPALSPGIRKLGSLKKEKGRLTHSAFLIEGTKTLAEVVNVMPDIIREVFVSESFTDKNFLDSLKKQRLKLRTVTASDIAFLSDAQSDQGILALARFSSLRSHWPSSRYVTLLDAVQDPGNVGAVLRTSVALGMDAVLLGKGCCELYNPKVVRASAGNFLRIPVETGVDLSGKINFLRGLGFTILTTSTRGRLTLDQVKLRKKVALIIGNEGAGVSDKLAVLADKTVRVPVKNNVESLNVAVAHGILAHSLIWGRK